MKEYLEKEKCFLVGKQWSVISCCKITLFSLWPTHQEVQTHFILLGHTQRKFMVWGSEERYNKAVNINCNHQQLRRKLLPQKQYAKIEIYPNYSCTYFYLSSYLHSSQGCVKRHMEKNKCLVRKKCG